MAGQTRTEKARKIRELLETDGPAVEENTLGFNEGRYESTARLDDYEALKAEARSIKEDAIEDLDALIETLTEAVEANGGEVYLAEDAADANDYIESVVASEDAETVVKSKSMTTEEIEVNHRLEDAGCEVWETDLGEFVLQVAEEEPSHIVGPAIHKSRESIADLFNETFEPDEPLETANDLTAFASEYLASRIEDADVGMTGANFIAAETGSMALVTSEGNARKCVTAADTHIAVAGIEKIVPTVADFQPFIELIGRSGTGQDITSYLSILTPPLNSPPIDFEDDQTPITAGDPDDRSFHLVLIDNGRQAMREDEHLKETLYCIRCSACANSCANFQSVGGHAFGGETYSGGIATGWESGVHGLDSAAEFNDFCTGCTRCVNQCPVNIDIPWINTVVRDRLNQGAEGDAFDHLVSGLTPDDEPDGMDLQKRVFGNFETLAKMGSKTAPVSNWLPNLPGGRWLLERTLGIDRRRALPAFKRETLTAWARHRTSQPDGQKVILYPDLYTNHVLTDRGKSAVAVLEALGYDVSVPPMRSSGRAPLSQGMIQTATDHAEAIAEEFEPYLEADTPILVLEPTDLAMFKHDYEKLIPSETAAAIREGCHDLFAFIQHETSEEERTAALAADSSAIRYHSHCQQRTLDLERPTVEILDGLGHDVVTSSVECCGMAGSFGYKREYYELSMDVGERLADQFETEPNRVALASGTSCQEQLHSLLEDDIYHPIELLDPGRSLTNES